MPENLASHRIVPGPRGGWIIKLRGSPYSLGLYATQAEALEAIRKINQQPDVSSLPHNKNEKAKNSHARSKPQNS
jgi:hypothetical protein